MAEKRLKNQQSKTIEVLVDEAWREYAAGETSGPFDNIDDLMKHLNS